MFASGITSIRKYTMSLLDKIDILITPNAYKKGKLFAALPSPTFGGELAVDGDFADGSTAWTLNPGWSIGGNSARYDGNALGTSIAQNISGVTGGNRYTVTFEVTQNTGDQNNTVSLGSTTLTNSTHLPLGCNTFTGVAGFGTALNIYGNSGEILIIRNLTVKQELTGIADLDFTRASAATRVDEDGLVNYAKILGDELVTNGDFATDSDWTLGTGATISNNLLNFDSVNNDETRQLNLFPTPPLGTYEVSFDISNYVGGHIDLYLGGYQRFDINADGNGAWKQTYVISHPSSNSTFYFIGDNFTGSIDNVSVKEVTRDNVPRIDYTGGGCPHILSEPQRRNLVTYSEAISNLTLLTNGTGTFTITDNYTDSPQGVQNASRVQMSIVDTNDGANYRLINTGSSMTIGVTREISFYAKSLTGLNQEVLVYWSYAKQIVTLTNDWQRFEISGTSDNSGAVLIGTRGGTTQYYAGGDANLDFAIWGLQVEDDGSGGGSSYATSYIPTSGGTVTRVQETYESAEDISGLINDSEGVLFAEIAALANDGTYREISLSDGTSTNRIEIRYTTTSNRIQVLIRNGSYLALQYDVSSIVDFNKVAFKWKTGDFALWVNGVERATDSTTFVTSGLNRLAFDQSPSGNEFFGKVKQIQVYDTALTDEELTLLTIQPNSTYSTYAEMANALNYTLQ